MPTPGAESPIQRVPSGLPGPGGTGFSPAAHGDAGGYHHGFLHLTTIWNRPSGVGYTVCPVATWNRRSNLMPSYTVSRFDCRLMTITGPIVRAVTFGLSTATGTAIAARVPWTSCDVSCRTVAARSTRRPTRDFVTNGLKLRSTSRVD